MTPKEIIDLSYDIEGTPGLPTSDQSYCLLTLRRTELKWLPRLLRMAAIEQERRDALLLEAKS